MFRERSVVAGGCRCDNPVNSVTALSQVIDSLNMASIQANLSVFRRHCPLLESTHAHICCPPKKFKVSRYREFEAAIKKAYKLLSGKKNKGPQLQHFLT